MFPCACQWEKPAGAEKVRPVEWLHSIRRWLARWTARPAVRWGSCAAYAALVLYLCLSSHPPVPQTAALIPYFDKLGHFSMYAGLMFFLEWAGALKRLKHPDLTFGSFAAVFGFLVEVAQGTLTKTRAFDLWDEAANIAGILTFLVAYRIIRKLRRVRKAHGGGTPLPTDSRQRRRNRRRRLRGKRNEGRQPFH
jgi:VanZ family protein